MFVISWLRSNSILTSLDLHKSNSAALNAKNTASFELFVVTMCLSCKNLSVLVAKSIERQSGACYHG